jgi:hypothetical protein
MRTPCEISLLNMPLVKNPLWFNSRSLKIINSFSVGAPRFGIIDRRRPVFDPFGFRYERESSYQSSQSFKDTGLLSDQDLEIFSLLGCYS